MKKSKLEKTIDRHLKGIKDSLMYHASKPVWLDIEFIPPIQIDKNQTIYISTEGGSSVLRTR